jgi:hypothetical protein
MIITKTSKNYNLISVNDVKEDLSIALSDSTYDAQLRRYIKSAIDEAEAKIGNDIAITSNVLEEFSYITPFYFSEYIIGQVGITVSAITNTYNGVISTVSASTYYIEKGQNSTKIKFANGVTGNVLKIYYQSGYSTAIPESIKHAVSIRVAAYIDVERNEYVQSSLVNSKAFDRLLSPFTNLY